MASFYVSHGSGPNGQWTSIDVPSVSGARRLKIRFSLYGGADDAEVFLQYQVHSSTGAKESRILRLGSRGLNAEELVNGDNVSLVAQAWSSSRLQARVTATAFMK